MARGIGRERNNVRIRVLPGGEVRGAECSLEWENVRKTGPRFPRGCRRPEQVDGIELVAVIVGNPHAVVRGDPDEIGRIGPRLLETARTVSRAKRNVQVVRVTARVRWTARVWSGAWGDEAASGRARSPVAAATATVTATWSSISQAATCASASSRATAYLTGPAERLS